MRKILTQVLVLASVISLSSARLFTADEKENFFEKIHATKEGENLISTITNHVLSKTTEYLKEKLAQDPFEANFKQCMMCKTAFSTIDDVVRTETVTNAIEAFAVLVCNQIESANTTVCPGAVKEMGDIMIPVLANFLLTPDYICNRVLTACSDVSFTVLDQ